MRQTRPFCLASASPRRKELLAQLGLTFEVAPPDTDETRHPGEAPPAYSLRIAESKARSALARFPAHLILAGDTVVVLGEEMLGKPATPGEATEMISRLSGKTHRVISAYFLLDGPSGERCEGIAETRVVFRPLPAEWIAWYGALPEAQDKAGAYAIQGVGGAMVERIEGSYATVVGFPTDAILWDLIRKGWVTL